MITTHTETIRDWQGRILGYIDSDNNGNQQARNFFGVILGSYDKSCDCTRNFLGVKLTQGNTVVGLIYKEAMK